MVDKRIEALTKATEKKKKEALEKTEKAIQTLIKNKHKITVRSVAKEAGVSASYIYKYPELAYRIQTLREKQKYYPVKPQSPSSKSHKVITTHLKNRIKILKQEKEELAKEIKILAANVYEIKNSSNTVDRLKAENIKLKEEIKILTRKLQSAKQELSESREFILNQGYRNTSEVKNTRINSKEKVIQLVPEERPVVSAILPGQSIKGMGEIDDEIQKLLSELGIRLSKTLIKEIKNKPREQVIGAISVVQENINTGVKVRSKVGLFRSALKEEWIANEFREERSISQNQDDFAEWYELAKEQGMIRESKMTDKGMAVYKLGDGWILVDELIEQGWSLKYLKQRNKKK